MMRRRQHRPAPKSEKLVTKLKDILLRGCAASFFLAAGCSGNGDRPSENAGRCRAMPPAEMSQSDYVCALAAEMRAIADALVTVNDRQTADMAIPALKKSRDRLQAVRKQQQRLNKESDPAGRAAMAGANMNDLFAANRAFLAESQRILKDHPELWREIGPFLEGIDFQ